MKVYFGLTHLVAVNRKSFIYIRLHAMYKQDIFGSMVFGGNPSDDHCSLFPFYGASASISSELVSRRYTLLVPGRRTQG